MSCGWCVPGMPLGPECDRCRERHEAEMRAEAAAMVLEELRSMEAPEALLAEVEGIRDRRRLEAAELAPVEAEPPEWSEPEVFDEFDRTRGVQDLATYDDEERGH